RFSYWRALIDRVFFVTWVTLARMYGRASAVLPMATDWAGEARFNWVYFAFASFCSARVFCGRPLRSAIGANFLQGTLGQAQECPANRARLPNATDEFLVISDDDQPLARPGRRRVDGCGRHIPADARDQDDVLELRALGFVRGHGEAEAHVLGRLVAVGQKPDAAFGDGAGGGEHGVDHA